MMASIEKRRDGSRVWLVSLAAASTLAFLSSVDGFQLLPTGIAFQQQRAAFSKTDLRVSMIESQDGGADKGRRVAEFMNLEPVRESDARRARLERDQETKDQFAAYGDKLWNLRKKMNELSENLVGVLNGKSRESEELIRHELRQAEQRDPELVYEMELLEMELAIREGDQMQARKSRQRALNARSCLPHFNLEGLWVGKYVFFPE